MTFTPPYPVLPPPAGDDATSAPRGRFRLRTTALFAAAVLAAGTAGGAVTAAMIGGDTAGTTVASSVTRTTSTVTAASDKTVTGTPESAAGVIGPSVVTLKVTGTQTVAGRGFGGAPQSQEVSGTGSGIVIRSDGYIVTNNHVVSAAANGGTVEVTFSNGNTAKASIVGRDSTSDLAVVKVSGARNLTAATFADSDALKVGQAVLAVGAPLGLSNTVTEGIVSTLHRPVSTGEQGASEQAVIDAVQTDAAINPGNSGGALVDLAGHVVGVNSAIATADGSSSGNIGVGFAIPSNDAANIADQLIADGHATHAQLGVSVTDSAAGATVQAVTSGGPAAKAGLRAGDVITKVGSRRVTDADSLVVAVRAQDPGAAVTVAYTRGGSSHTTTAQLTTATPAT
jgi:putative serine protease PepD